MKNIHLLPTEKPSILGRFIDTNNLFLRASNDIPRGENVNIYITSDEEIKEGDWCIEFTPNNEKITELFKCNEEQVLNISTGTDYKYKKIILTTDQDLIKDGVQEINEEFLEWFVKNPNCEQISVEEVYFHGSGYYKASELSEQEREKYSFMKEYKIIIPKEEPKQETLEEAAEKYSENWEEITGLDYENTVPSEVNKLDFINGAKWQQEQNKNLYSEEDMHKLMYEYQEWLVLTLEPVKTFEEWFKQFKKK